MINHSNQTVQELLVLQYMIEHVPCAAPRQMETIQDEMDNLARKIFPDMMTKLAVFKKEDEATKQEDYDTRMAIIKKRKDKSRARQTLINNERLIIKAVDEALAKRRWWKRK